MTIRPVLRCVLAAIAGVWLAASSAEVRAADQWREVKSAHFTVTSSASEGSAKTIAWQLEQIRSAIATLWPWAKVDPNEPLAIFVVKDEIAMKALAPMYWERKGGVRPATFWVGGPDQNYLAIRTDVEAEDQLNINPYVSSYFSYISLILQQSVARPLPLWLSRGLAGVMSNTVVRDAKIMVGPPIPWHLERLRERGRISVPALLKITRTSREVLDSETLSTFDAASWALVHYLMFGENGTQWPRLDRFAQMVAGGTDPDVAFRETLGSAEEIDGRIRVYVSRSLFTFREVRVDVSVKREGFTVKPLTAAEAASRQALLHTAMRRPVEARRAIDEARKAGPAPDTFVAEGLLLDAGGNADAAQAAFASAVAADTTQPYAYYRLASLMWRTQVDREALGRIEQLLSRAIALNSRYAAAFAMLGDARSALGIGEPMGLVLRAIALEPGEPHFQLTAARDLALPLLTRDADIAQSGVVRVWWA